MRVRSVGSRSSLTQSLKFDLQKKDRARLSSVCDALFRLEPFGEEEKKALPVLDKYHGYFRVRFTDFLGLHKCNFNKDVGVGKEKKNGEMRIDC